MSKKFRFAIDRGGTFTGKIYFFGLNSVYMHLALNLVLAQKGLYWKFNWTYVQVFGLMF